MRKMMAVVLCCLWSTAATAEAAFNPRGQWLGAMPTVPSYAATLLVDGDRRATWDGRWDPKEHPLGPGGVSRVRGYVQFDDSILEIILGDGTNVMRLRCAIQSSDLLHCRGKTGALSILTRIGPGPAKLVAGRK